MLWNVLSSAQVWSEKHCVNKTVDHTYLEMQIYFHLNPNKVVEKHFIKL